MKNVTNEQQVLIVDENQGIYCGQHLAKHWELRLPDGSNSDTVELYETAMRDALAGPDDEDYQEAVDWLIDNCYIVIQDKRYSLFWSDSEIWGELMLPPVQRITHPVTLRLFWEILDYITETSNGVYGIADPTFFRRGKLVVRDCTTYEFTDYTFGIELTIKRGDKSVAIYCDISDAALYPRSGWDNSWFKEIYADLGYLRWLCFPTKSKQLGIMSEVQAIGKSIERQEKKRGIEMLRPIIFSDGNDSDDFGPHSPDYCMES